MSKVRIWIRHAAKIYRNGRSPTLSFQHDSPIKESEIVHCVALRSFLSDLYDEPDMILCSPYTRTRETASNMNRCSPMIVDCALSEYLGNQVGRPDRCKETNDYNPPSSEETWRQLRRRVEKHLDNALSSSTNIMWIVTHGVIIGLLHSLIQSRLNAAQSSSYYPKELEGIIIEQTGCKLSMFLIFRKETTELTE